MAIACLPAGGEQSSAISMSSLYPPWLQPMRRVNIRRVDRLYREASQRARDVSRQAMRFGESSCPRENTCMHEDMYECRPLL